LKRAKTRRRTRKPLTSVLVKPAGADCNLSCAYCFYTAKAALYPETRRPRMSPEILEEMVRQVMRYGGPFVSFGWQGGEPTLMGPDFYRRAVELQERHGRPGQTVGNGMQTNGLLIDDQWCRLLARHSFLVGLSLDGPRHIHDRYRTDRGGAGTWARVCDAARRLLDGGVAVNALVLVNDYSVRYPREIYEFLKELGLTFMQFIPCVETDPLDDRRAAPFSVAGNPYGRFLCELFDLWRADFKDGQPTTSVRFFESVLYTYAGLPAPECSLLEECGGYVVVEHNGDVYACDFFVEPEWKLGNLAIHSLAAMLNSSRQGGFGRLKKRVPGECAACRWLPYCRGGCTKDRLRVEADGGSNHFCEAYRMFFAHAHGELTRLAGRGRGERQSSPGTAAHT